MPLVLKGILTAEDARLAVEHGVDAIVVSNHGARQLDRVAATADVLEEVVAAVDGRTEVWVDGGIRRGLDVVDRAGPRRARRARRPAAPVGPGRDGAAGVASALAILREEFEIALALLGRRRPSREPTRAARASTAQARPDRHRRVADDQRPPWHDAAMDRCRPATGPCSLRRSFHPTPPEVPHVRPRPRAGAHRARHRRSIRTVPSAARRPRSSTRAHGRLVLRCREAAEADGVLARIGAAVLPHVNRVIVELEEGIAA